MRPGFAVAVIAGGAWVLTEAMLSDENSRRPLRRLALFAVGILVSVLAAFMVLNA